ncbi:MAG: DNRLRE domain-containing protein [Chloroflexota bacterium]
MNRMQYKYCTQLLVTLIMAGALSTILTVSAENGSAQNLDSSTNEKSALQEFSPIADTYMASGRPDERRPMLEQMWVGYNGSDGSEIERSLIKFDLSGIPQNAQIQSATLKLHLSSNTSRDDPLPITVSMFVNDWLEDTNWNESGHKPITPGGVTVEIGTSRRVYEWNVTTLVQQWQQERPANGSELSLILQGDENRDRNRERAFRTKDCPSDEADCSGPSPVLVIEFEIPTPTSTPTFTPTPAPTLGLRVEASYQRVNGTPEPIFPTDIGLGEPLTITIFITRVNSNTGLNNVVLTGYIPQGMHYEPSESDLCNFRRDTEVQNTYFLRCEEIAIAATGSVSRTYVVTRTLPIENIFIDNISEAGEQEVSAEVEPDSANRNVKYDWYLDSEPIQLNARESFTHTFEPGDYQLTVIARNPACRRSGSLRISIPDNESGSESAKNVIPDGAFLMVEDGAGRAATLLPECVNTINVAAPAIIVEWYELLSDGSTEMRKQYLNLQQLPGAIRIYVPYYIDSGQNITD